MWWPGIAGRRLDTMRPRRPRRSGKAYYVYILSSATGVLYTGVTNDLRRRLHEHRTGSVPGFSRRYAVHRLHYFESTPDVLSAIAREQQIKGMLRAKKLVLIRSVNPTFSDLAADVEEDPLH
jgi:putative endonuclease